MIASSREANSVLDFVWSISMLIVIQVLPRPLCTRLRVVTNPDFSNLRLKRSPRRQQLDPDVHPFADTECQFQRDPMHIWLLESVAA